MSRPVIAIADDLKHALAEALDNVIAAQVCEEDSWRRESFVDALRNLRHLKQLAEELTAQPESEEVS